MSIDAMKQALHTLEGWANHGEWVWPESALEQAKRNTTESITALRAAIEQAQEPVALEAVYEIIIHWDEGGGKRSRRELARRIAALYTAPRQWQGLTDEDVDEVERWVEFKEDGSGRIPTQKLVRYIERKLKEKNNAR